MFTNINFFYSLSTIKFYSLSTINRDIFLIIEKKPYLNLLGFGPLLCFRYLDSAHFSILATSPFPLRLISPAQTICTIRPSTMAEELGFDISVAPSLYFLSAFLAMEPADSLLSMGRYHSNNPLNFSRKMFSHTTELSFSVPTLLEFYILFRNG